VQELSPATFSSTVPLKDSGKEEPEVGVRVAFETPEGKLVTVVLSQRPLGFKYTKAMPLTITDVKPRSHGDLLGIKKGWTIKSIEDEDMTGTHDGNAFRLRMH